jgi:hypothetical protein
LEGNGLHQKIEKIRYFWAENNSKNQRFSQKNACHWHSKAIPEMQMPPAVGLSMFEPACGPTARRTWAYRMAY